MNLTKVIGVIAVVGITLGNFHLAVADTATVPLNELNLVEESAVSCPEYAAADENAGAADEVALHNAHYGGHNGSHYGGHNGNHYGGHNGNHYGGHHRNRLDGDVDVSNLPQPNVALKN